jgi:hypothetical protein
MPERMGICIAAPWVGCGDHSGADAAPRLNKLAGYLIAALVALNEIRGVVVVVGVGWPMLKAMWSGYF